MEDTLRVGNWQNCYEYKEVLILVLMEDTLRVFVVSPCVNNSKS